MALLGGVDGFVKHRNNSCIKSGLNMGKRYEKLHLPGYTNLTDNVVVCINKHSSLEELDVSGTFLTNEFLKSLTLKLTIINLWGCAKLTDDSIFDFVKKTESLRLVMIQENKSLILDSRIKSLKTRIEELKRDIIVIESVEYTPITDEVRTRFKK